MMHTAERHSSYHIRSKDLSWLYSWRKCSHTTFPIIITRYKVKHTQNRCSSLSTTKFQRSVTSKDSKREEKEAGNQSIVNTTHFEEPS